MSMFCIMHMKHFDDSFVILRKENIKFIYIKPRSSKEGDEYKKIILRMNDGEEYVIADDVDPDDVKDMMACIQEDLDDDQTVIE